MFAGPLDGSLGGSRNKIEQRVHRFLGELYPESLKMPETVVLNSVIFTVSGHEGQYCSGALVRNKHFSRGVSSGLSASSGYEIVQLCGALFRQYLV
jgi:hypothetical protein